MKAQPTDSRVIHCDGRTFPGYTGTKIGDHVQVCHNGKILQGTVDHKGIKRYQLRYHGKPVACREDHIKVGTFTDNPNDILNIINPKDHHLYSVENLILLREDDNKTPIKLKSRYKDETITCEQRVVTLPRSNNLRLIINNFGWSVVFPGCEKDVRIDGDGPRVTVTYKTTDNKFESLYLHVIIAKEFIPNPSNLPCVRVSPSSDKFKLAIWNLEWCSGEDCSADDRNEYSDDQIHEACLMIAAGCWELNFIAFYLGVRSRVLSSLVQKTGKTYQHIYSQYQFPDKNVKKFTNNQLKVIFNLFLDGLTPEGILDTLEWNFNNSRKIQLDALYRWLKQNDQLRNKK